MFALAAYILSNKENFLLGILLPWWIYTAAGLWCFSFARRCRRHTKWEKYSIKPVHSRVWGYWWHRFYPRKCLPRRRFMCWYLSHLISNSGFFGIFLFKAMIFRQRICLLYFSTGLCIIVSISVNFVSSQLWYLKYASICLLYYSWINMFF